MWPQRALTARPPLGRGFRHDNQRLYLGTEGREISCPWERPGKVMPGAFSRSLRRRGAVYATSRAARQHPRAASPAAPLHTRTLEPRARDRERRLVGRPHRDLPERLRRRASTSNRPGFKLRREIDLPRPGDDGRGDGVQIHSPRLDGEGPSWRRTLSAELQQSLGARTYAFRVGSGVRDYLLEFLV